MTLPVHMATQADSSAWVGANAGSGKTFILVTRLVRLMLSGVAPEKLLCLTYTRSAAAEMQDRLFDLLADWALLDDAQLASAIEARLGPQKASPDLPLARMLFARALETPGGLRVQTIHAFCESLLKRFPLEAGLSPQFTLLDEYQARAVQSQLIRQLLTRPENDALATSLALLTRQMGEPELEQLAHSVIGQRNRFDIEARDAQLVALTGKLGFAGEVPSLQSWIGTHIDRHTSAATGLAKWLVGSANKTDHAQAARLGAFVRAAHMPDRTHAFACLQDVFMTTRHEPRKSLVTQSHAKESPEKTMQLAEWADDFAACWQGYRAINTYRLTEALYHFAAHLQRDYAEAKARRSVLDYDDLIARTNQMLNQNQAAAWVLFKIDGGLEHILVDEAQDTSPAQWQVIRALADEFFVGDTAHDGVRTIFAVGDEKQSIFSFQGADPAAFDAQYRHFAAAIEAVGGQLHYVPLIKSWRSTPQVLQLVDEVFATPEARSGLNVADQELHHLAARAQETGYVALWEVEKNDASDMPEAVWQVPAVQLPQSGRQKLARRIADKIAGWLVDPASGIGAGDILILVRKRDAFIDDMIRALKRRRVGVAGADRMILTEQIAVMDLLTAAEFALHPEDDLSLACLLRSPLGGLDETALFELAHGRKGSLWQALLQLTRGASADTRVHGVHQRLSWLLKHVDYLSPYDFFADLLGPQGGHAALRHRLGPEIDDPIGEFLRLAMNYESRHVASMQGFLHFLRQGEQEIKRDMEADHGVVRIMTVHGAKGLEAPIVFLPDTCQPMARSRRSAIYFDDDKLPLWRASKVLRDDFGADQEAHVMAAEMAESRRLLYVALTRARDQLYIGGYIGAQAKKPPDDSWYQMIANVMQCEARQSEEDGRMVWQLGAVTPTTANEATKEDKTVWLVPDWLRQSIDPATCTGPGQGKVFAPSRFAPPAGAAAHKADMDDNAARQRGNLAHKLFEKLPFVLTAQRSAAGQAYLDRHGDFLTPAARTALLAEIEAVLTLPELQPIFSRAARAEVPIAGYVTLDSGKRLAFSGQIDRYVMHEGAVWLVDFKTGVPADTDTTSSDIPSGRTSSRASDYVLQMAIYRHLMQGVYQNHARSLQVRCGLVWSQNAHVQWLDDGMLDAAFADIVRGVRRPF